MAGNDMRAVEVPFAMSEDAVVYGDTSRDGQDGEVLNLTLNLTRGHVVSILGFFFALLFFGRELIDGQKETGNTKGKTKRGDRGEVDEFIVVLPVPRLPRQLICPF